MINRVCLFQNQSNLRSTITTKDRVIVFRKDSETYEEIFSDELVPGDIIEIPSHGCEMHCDAVLISGNAIGN